MLTVADCYGDEFMCSSGSNAIQTQMLFCADPQTVCDGEHYCHDGSDETDGCGMLSSYVIQL